MNTHVERIIQLVSPLSDKIELLVLGCSLDDANLYTQTLRNAGMSVHLNTVNKQEELDHLLNQKVKTDIVLVNCDAEEIDFTTAIRQIRHMCPNTSFILLSDDPSGELFFAVETRAHDIIERHDHAHLIYVVNREQYNLQLRREVDKLKTDLQELRARYNTLTETSGEAIAYIQQGMHLYANPAYIKLFGLKPEDIEGLPFMDLIHKDDQAKFKPILHKLDEEHTAEKIEINGVTKDGRIIPVTMEFAPTVVEGENCTQVIIHDRSPELTLKQRMKKLADYDIDTGLYNRKYFLKALEQALQKEAIGRQSLLIINIANYENIKTEYGIDTAEDILKAVAQILEKTTYKTDVVSRFGDHEFAILPTPDSDAEALAQRLHQALDKEIFRSGEHLINVQHVIGIVHSDQPPCRSSRELITRATRAWRKALDEGKFYEVFDEAMPDEDSTEIDVDKRLVDLIDYALEKDRFQLVYQPVVSLHGNSREDYSVYVRLLDEDGKEVLPKDFFETAIKSKRMADIDRWVIRNAIKALAEYRAEGRKINFLINISASGIDDDSLLLWICDCLREFKAKGAWICFIFAQEDILANLDKADQLAQGLKKINCKVAVSHFNLEQEAIGVVKHIGADLAVFNSEVTANLLNDKDTQSLLKTYNDELHDINVKTVVTHIEQAAQLTILWTVGVDFIQGDFIQPPSPSIVYETP